MSNKKANNKSECKNTLEESLDIMTELFLYQSKIYELRQKLDKRLEEIGINGVYNMFDPLTAQNVCHKISIHDNFKTVYAEALKQNIHLAINVLKDSWNQRDKPGIEAIAAINALIDYPDELFDIAISDKQRFTEEQTKYLWENYRDYLFKKYSLAPNKLEIFCRVFKDYIQYEHKELLVKRICGRKNEIKAKELKHDKEINLPQDLIEKLDSMLMINKLIS